MRRRSGGFTVIEAVVSLALAALFMMLAAQLMRATQIASLATRREALDPTPQHIAQQLRRDVHRSAGTLQLRGSASTLWNRGALTLMLPDSSIVRYEKTAEEVSRSLYDAAGAHLGTRPLLRGVLSWRWQQISTDLIEVEILFRQREAREALRRTAQDYGPSIDGLRMRLAMRAAPGRRSW